MAIRNRTLDGAGEIIAAMTAVANALHRLRQELYGLDSEDWIALAERALARKRRTTR